MYEAKLLNKTSNYNWDIYETERLDYLDSKISNWCIKIKVSLLKKIAVNLLSNKEEVCFKLGIKDKDTLIKNKYL